MPNFFSRFPFSLPAMCFGLVAVLALAYIGLIAVAMSYAALTVNFSQSVKNDETTVGLLESQYLAAVARITDTDYAAAGYTMPIAEIFVPTENATALR
jgi:cell division protein FtsX